MANTTLKFLNLDEINKLREHFDEARNLATFLEMHQANINDCLSNKDNDLPHESLKFFNEINQKLVMHLKTVKYDTGFYNLMYQTSHQTLNWLLKNPEFDFKEITPGIHPDDLKFLIRGTIKEFHNKLQEHFQQVIRVPKIIFETPKDEEKRESDLGGFDLDDDGNPFIKINDFTTVFNQIPTTALATAIHESVHSAQSLLFRQLTTDKKNTYGAVTHRSYNALLWELSHEFNYYIFGDLSPEAYEAQAIERIAFDVENDFLHALEEKIYLANRPNKTIIASPHSQIA